MSQKFKLLQAVQMMVAQQKAYDGMTLVIDGYEELMRLNDNPAEKKQFEVYLRAAVESHTGMGHQINIMRNTFKNLEDHWNHGTQLRTR